MAIAQEYAEKIRKAQEENGVNSAQVKLLEKQRDVAIQNKETEAIKANIDWVTVFGEFGSMFSDMIKPALDEAKKYVRTDKFKNSDQASQKSLIDAISQMEKSLGGTSGVNFKKLGEDVKAYQIAEQNRISAIGIETAALERLKKSQDDYTKAQKGGTESEKQAAANALETARQNADIASANVKTQTDIANQAQRNVTDTATILKASMENLLGGLQQISSGGLYNAYSGIIKTVNGFKDVIGKTSESLKEVPIVGWILSIIDVLKDGLSDLVGGLLDAVLNAVSGIIGDVLSGDLFVTIGKSLRNGIGNILNAISFGGFNSLFGIGGNAKEVQETINRLTERNEILGKSIDRLTDIMEKSAGSKAISAYEEARKNQQEKNENLLDIAQAQASYHNSHKSWQYYMRWIDEQLKWAQENVDASFTGTNSLWNLTPEQMNKLLSNVNIYEQIKNAGKGGYGGRVMEDLEEYAEQAGKIADLEASINESLMNVSFDSLRSSFLDSLMDMEKDAKGFSDDFSEMMQRALLGFSLGETFYNELKDWYNDVAKSISENSGKLSEMQIADFKKRYDDIVNAAMYERDKIAELTGYTGGKDSTREVSQKGIATASQDSVDENNGRLAVMQGHTYSINENVNCMAIGIDTITAHTVNLSCLTSIDKAMQSILSMRDASLTHLSNIDSHTARLEAIENAIVFMKNDINTMLIKGLKLSKN